MINEKDDEREGFNGLNKQAVQGGERAVLDLKRVPVSSTRPLVRSSDEEVHLAAERG